MNYFAVDGWVHGGADRETDKATRGKICKKGHVWLISNIRIRKEVVDYEYERP